MAGTTFKKGTRIYGYGQPMSTVGLITKGQVNVKYPGGQYLLSSGDIIGICEICSEIHFLEYVANDDCVVMDHPINNVEALEQMLSGNTALARLFMVSAFRQISTLLDRSSLFALNCSSIYRDLTDDYQNYVKLCQKYNLPVRTLDGLDEVGAYLGDEAPDYWLNSLYSGFAHLCKDENNSAIIEENGIAIGMLRKCSLDFRRTYTGLEEQYQYLKLIMQFLLNKEGEDLFDFYATLYYKLSGHAEEADSIYGDINRILLQIQDFEYDDPQLVTKRIDAFYKHVALMDTQMIDNKEEPVEEKVDSVGQQTVDSMNTILAYAGLSTAECERMTEHIHAYAALSDKASTEDTANQLRKALTEEFYLLYTAVFVQSLKTKSMPLPVKMFLYFGYIDENLAGAQNTNLLSKLANVMEHREGSKIYTFYQWLLEIYAGRKDPSRSEFDVDYHDYVHKLKTNNNLTAAQVTQLEEDKMGRVNYELQNMFPPVNKMTFGRITTYCPFFISENVLKDLSGCLVDESAIEKAVNTVKAVDYSAFYRETLDTVNVKVMGKESIHVEYLPDVILMPNVGIRSVMWQEIEGRVRTTPSRMVFSVFHMEDITTSFIRMTGEFRWEMCKRIQGSRWNDITDRSLTSEYFDYVQFYKKNHDLTAEAKERVRTSLQRVKNSFKEMFVRDYIIWILFEGNSSPRLNKVARKILFTYCPFPKEILQQIGQNPLYTEILHGHAIKTAQKLHLLTMLQKKLMNAGVSVPDTLAEEIAFYDRTAIPL